LVYQRERLTRNIERNEWERERKSEKKSSFRAGEKWCLRSISSSSLRFFLGLL
jgi:hypothetical protein